MYVMKTWEQVMTVFVLFIMCLGIFGMIAPIIQSVFCLEEGPSHMITRYEYRRGGQVPIHIEVKTCKKWR